MGLTRGATAGHIARAAVESICASTAARRVTPSIDRADVDRLRGRRHDALGRAKGRLNAGAHV